MNIKYFKNDKCLVIDITKNKSLEAQLTSDPWSWFNFACRWSTKTDHAGLTLVITLCKIEFSTQIYDRRHWNYDEDRWYLPGEDFE